MRITVEKSIDGKDWITHDSFGTLFGGDVEVDAGDEPVSDDATVALESREKYGETFSVGVFSWVDYKDSGRVDPHPTGVRHRSEWTVPGSGVFGPYTVTAE